MDEQVVSVTRLGSTRERLKRLGVEFLKPHRAAIFLALGAMLVQSLLVLPLPLLQGWVLDSIVSAPREGLAWLVALALGASVLCYLGRMGLAWLAASTMTRVSLEVVRHLTDALHRKLQRLPMAYFDSRQTGRLMARVTSDVGTLLIFLNSGSLQLAADLMLAAGIAGVLLWLNWKLALVAFAVLPCYVFNHRFFAVRIRRLSQLVRAQVASLYALLSERISAVRTVKSFAQEEGELGELDSRIDQHRSLGWDNMKAGALQGALATLISGIGTAAVLCGGVLLVRGGGLSLGGLLAFYALLGQLYNPLVRLTQFQGTLAATVVAIDRMVEVLDEPETVTDRPDARPICRPRGNLTFRDVSFAYRPGDLPVLSRVNLEIEAGMTVGLLGASGSGKSTLLALAPRIYDIEPGRGTVLLDGLDVRGLRLADLRRAVALVPQQALLFEGTIRSNLTYAAPAAPERALRRALEAVDLDGLVGSLREGLDTHVGERGVSLSGGQRQRLALARALIADPAVLLLDDCTSALDAETEAHVQQALDDLLPGRTRVIVSHKVSSVRRADLIVVLKEGRILEQGSHEQLLARGGAYAETFHLQTGILAVGQAGP